MILSLNGYALRSSLAWMHLRCYGRDMRVSLLVWVLAGCATAAESASVHERYQVARATGQWAEAYGLATELLCDNPSLTTGLEMVELWDRLGRPSRPDRHFDTCELPPWVSGYVRALVHATVDELTAALAELRSAGETIDGERKYLRDYAETQFRRGLVLSLADRNKEAIEAFDLAVFADPARVDIRVALSAAKLVVEGPAVAVSTLEGILSLAPSASELQRARETLRHAVRKSEPALSREAQLQISEILSDIEKDQVSHEDVARLRNDLERVNHPRFRTVVGLFMLKLGRLSEGSHYLSQAAAENPIDPEPLRSLGTTLYSAGRGRAALPHLRGAVARDPFDVMTLNVLAEAAAGLDDIPTAAMAYERLSVLEPHDAENYLWLARMERKRGDLPSARRAVVRGCELVARSIPLYLERASIEAEITLGARSALERAEGRRRTRSAISELLRIAPGHPGAQPILNSLAAID